MGNISAGSWGPENWLAYVTRHGFFDADVVVLVVNSGDYADNPTFKALDDNHPTQKPTLALQEAIVRYLPAYLPKFSKENTSEPIAPESPNAAEILRGLTGLKNFLVAAQSTVGIGKVIIMHHPDRPEFLTEKYNFGHIEMANLAAELKIPFINLLPIYRKQGNNLYRDGIHHNSRGQEVLAEALVEVVHPLLTEPTK